MTLQPVQPHPLLAPYIHTFVVFESPAGHPLTSSRIIAPTGCAKIVLPYKNDLQASNERLLQKHPEGKIQFIGISDEPIVVSSPEQASGTVIIELTSQGARRFTHFAMQEVTNLIFPFDTLFEKEGNRLQEQIGNAGTVLKKIDLLQAFLIKKMAAPTSSESVVDYAVGLIEQQEGRISIRELERRTGYSARYLNLLFQEHVGLSPKTLASVNRFQHFYHLWAKNPAPDFFKKDLYDFYYDQSHMIREFKRFTGFTPVVYAETENEFGRIFHR
jgi:AraC-like DNA-binding protein